jgi:hypothetical protein
MVKRTSAACPPRRAATHEKYGSIFKKVTIQARCHGKENLCGLSARPRCDP